MAEKVRAYKALKIVKSSCGSQNPRIAVHHFHPSTVGIDGKLADVITDHAIIKSLELASKFQYFNNKTKYHNLPYLSLDRAEQLYLNEKKEYDDMLEQRELLKQQKRQHNKEQKQHKKEEEEAALKRRKKEDDRKENYVKDCSNFAAELAHDSNLSTLYNKVTTYQKNSLVILEDQLSNLRQVQAKQAAELLAMNERIEDLESSKAKIEIELEKSQDDNKMLRESFTTQLSNETLKNDGLREKISIDWKSKMHNLNEKFEAKIGNIQENHKKELDDMQSAHESEVSQYISKVVADTSELNRLLEEKELLVRSKDRTILAQAAVIEEKVRKLESKVNNFIECGGLNRFNITSDSWHDKNPEACHNLFGFKTFKIMKVFLRCCFPKLLQNVGSFCNANKHITEFEECLVCIMKFHRAFTDLTMSLMWGKKRSSINNYINKWGPILGWAGNQLSLLDAAPTWFDFAEPQEYKDNNVVNIGCVIDGKIFQTEERRGMSIIKRAQYSNKTSSAGALLMDWMFTCGVGFMHSPLMFAKLSEGQLVRLCCKLPRYIQFEDKEYKTYLPEKDKYL